ncbi:MAG TPA: c-type cytochrome domain-containing protein, partial [Pirellulales bacterium]
MCMPRVLKPAAICLVLLASMGRAWAEDFDAAAVEFFETSVRPLLVERCYKCHGDIATPKGGLKLTSRAAVLMGGDSGAAAIAGKAQESLLVEAIEYRDSLQMPPDAKLSQQQTDVLRKWVSL